MVKSLHPTVEIIKATEEDEPRIETWRNRMQTLLGLPKKNIDLGDHHVVVFGRMKLGTVGSLGPVSASYEDMSLEKRDIDGHLMLYYFPPSRKGMAEGKVVEHMLDTMKADGEISRIIVPVPSRFVQRFKNEGFEELGKPIDYTLLEGRHRGKHKIPLAGKGVYNFTLMKRERHR